MAIKRVREPFVAVVGGVPRAYPAGQLIDDTDPVFKGRERLFEDVEAGVRRVEQATAAPGEKRSVRRPARQGKSKGEGQ